MTVNGQRSTINETRSTVNIHSAKAIKRRMKLLQGASQVFSVEMGIDFSGGDAFMAEHFLYSAQVCASFYQVGGE